MLQYAGILQHVRLAHPEEARPISMYEQVKRKDWAQSFY